MSSKVYLVGTPVNDFELYYSSNNQNFYRTTLSIMRNSGTFDYIPIVAPENIALDNISGKRICLCGEIRTRNEVAEGKNKLIAFCYANSIDFTDEEDENNVMIEGYVCKSIKSRKTPFGRIISDILIASNRPYNKSDYVPCIVWGKNALKCEIRSVGDMLKIYGRIQSREYEKDNETRTAYEVSAYKIE